MSEIAIMETIQLIRDRLMSHHTYLLEQLEVKYMDHIQTLLMQKMKIIEKMQRYFYEELRTLDILFMEAYLHRKYTPMKVEWDCKNNIRSYAQKHPINYNSIHNDITSAEDDTDTLHDVHDVNLLNTMNVPSLETHSHADSSRITQRTSQTEINKRQCNNAGQPSPSIIPRLEKVSNTRYVRRKRVIPKIALKCPYPKCHQTRSSKDKLETHIRTHEKRRYACHYVGCGKRFGKKWDLQNHIMTHTGEKPFKCTHHGCNKAFSRNCHLTNHMRIHTGEKPYHCQICKKRFHSVSAKNHHIKRSRHHKC
eukprot:905967_1